ncbi:MAG: hypothetical protein GW913_06830 [Myxococcales bacterium]|nr:hypothetical protein [Myxococcales bacterium]
MQRLVGLGLSALVLLASPGLASARDFYVEPATGSPDGDGSMAAPWRTVEEVVAANLIQTRNWTTLPYADGATLGPVNAGAPIQAGDTLWLGSGYHGALEITGAYNSAPITIAAEPGATPGLSHVRLRSVGGWVLRGVSVSPSYAPSYDPMTAIDVDTHGYSGPSMDVRVEGCRVFSVEDISGWSASDWVAMAVNGITSDGDDVTVRDNTLTNVHFGISMSGARAQVLNNSVRNFSGDGMRGLGDDSLFEHNYVANCYDVDDNHDDGFQSWSVGPDGVGTGEVRGMTLRGNIIVNREDPAQALSGPLQGIGCFDGYFTDWVIENNVILVDHWHGITLLGARDSRIVNNTVMDINSDDPGPPWIMIAPHKDGTEGTGNLVRNNLATAIANGGGGIVEDHNLLITDAAALFVSPSAPWDLHLLRDAPAVDVGSSEQAPVTDRDGVARPFGAAVDVGAYEWTDVPPPADAGVGTDAGRWDAGADGGGASADAGTVGDAGTTASSDGGCGCSVPGATSTDHAPWLLAFFGLVVMRRRVTR